MFSYWRIEGKIFAIFIFASAVEFAKFAKILPRKKFAPYGISMQSSSSRIWIRVVPTTKHYCLENKICHCLPCVLLAVTPRSEQGSSHSTQNTVPCLPLFENKAYLRTLGVVIISAIHKVGTDLKHGHFSWPHSGQDDGCGHLSDAQPMRSANLQIT